MGGAALNKESPWGNVRILSSNGFSLAELWNFQLAELICC